MLHIPQKKTKQFYSNNSVKNITEQLNFSLINQHVTTGRYYFYLTFFKDLKTKAPGNFSHKENAKPRVFN